MVVKVYLLGSVALVSWSVRSTVDGARSLFPANELDAYSLLLEYLSYDLNLLVLFNAICAALFVLSSTCKEVRMSVSLFCTRRFCDSKSSLFIYHPRHIFFLP